MQRWSEQKDGEDDRRHGPKTAPANKLSEHEQQRLLRALTSPQSRDQSPRQVIPALAEQGDRTNMTDSIEKTDAFFYGLYMDADLLRSLGIVASNARVARIDDFELDLRGAVKVLPKKGKSVWGVIFELSKPDLNKMYSGPKTKAYQPSQVRAVTTGGETLEVGCYNQPEDPGALFNSAYMAKLIPAMEKAGLPSEYVAKMRALAELQSSGRHDALGIRKP